MTEENDITAPAKEEAAKTETKTSEPSAHVSSNDSAPTADAEVKKDAEEKREPEQPKTDSASDNKEDSGPAGSSTLDTKDTDQPKIDSAFDKKDDTEPVKPTADEPQASGALPVNDSTDKSAANSETTKEAPPDQSSGQTDDKSADEQTNGASADSKQTTETPAADTTEKPPANGTSEQTTKATNGDAVEPKARDGDMPSSILEKGIVYFFLRARVNVNDPSDVNDIARSYMILRPLPKGAKLGAGPIGDESNCRLIAIPKKVLPLSGKDRFMSFVESAKQSFTDLKSNFIASSDYATKTQGTSHSPAATPIAEGVYAITTTGKDSHFAYMTTLPQTLGEVQKDVGIKEQGSFALSAKNPKYPGPANASLQKQPEYSSSIMEEFRDLRWGALKPEMLDYEHCQFLLVGESQGPDSALEQLPRDEKKGLDDPMTEMERLEGEDELRVQHLKGMFVETSQVFSPKHFMSLARSLL